MNTVYKYANRVLVMNHGSLVYDGNAGELFKSDNLQKWNLDLPEIIEIARSLENKLNVKFKETPHTIDHLYELLKGVL
jgi:ABC-type multidrug transport system ATPase subunit